GEVVALEEDARAACRTAERIPQPHRFVERCGRTRERHARQAVELHALSSVSRRSSVCSSTSAPVVMSSGDENSSAEWLIPPRLGTKIMPMGPRYAISCASWPAPL